MQVVSMLATLVILFISYGVRGTSMKFAQSGRVSTLMQSLVFTTLYSAVQGAVLLIVPPYPSLVLEAEFYIYPIGFTVFYILGYMCLIMAISCGSSSITNTINSFNCLIPVFFSIAFMGEDLSLYTVIGLSLFAAGLILYNKSSYSVDGVKHKITGKWLFYTVASLVGVGTAVIFTKTGMTNFPDYGEEYLIWFNLMSTFVGGMIILLFGRNEAKKLLPDKKFVLHTVVAAIAFDVTNYIFVTYINDFASAFFLPLCSVVGMIAGLVFGRIFLKEKISRSAIISSVICIAAIALLNF